MAVINKLRTENLALRSEHRSEILKLRNENSQWKKNIAEMILNYMEERNASGELWATLSTLNYKYATLPAAGTLGTQPTLLIAWICCGAALTMAQQ